MTHNLLLTQFLNEECTTYVRRLICEAFERWKLGGPIENRRFEFNRFELTLDFEEETATLEDVLDATISGTHDIPLNAFINAIECNNF